MKVLLIVYTIISGNMTEVKKSEMARVFSSGVIKMGADSKKLGARIPYIYEITEAGKELHQDMQKGN